MTSFCILLAVFLTGEIFALLLFPIVRWRLAQEKIVKKPDIQTFKGVLERLVLFVGLSNGFATVLVVFGALKLGTRLHEEEQDKKLSNNYFLVGNFLSLLVAMVDSAAATKIIAAVVTVAG